MQQFTRIQAKDTFSYAFLDFDFRTGLSSIEGANGSSKSSIFMTLCQGLFNRNPKACKVDEVNNFITGLPSEITIWYQDGEDEYVFLNSRKLGKITVSKNGRDISQKRIPENLAMISEILGADYATFVDLIYQSKESTLNLLETTTDKGRKDFVNRVLRLEEIDSELAKMKDREKELAGKNGKIASLNLQIAALESSLGELMEIGTEYDLGEEENSLHRANLEVEKLAEEVTLLERDVKDLTAQQDLWFKEQQLREQFKTLSEGFDDQKVVDLDSLQRVATEATVEQSQQATVVESLKTTKALFEKYAGITKKRVAAQATLDALPIPEMELTECRVNMEKINKVWGARQSKLDIALKERDAFIAAANKGVCPTCGSHADVTSQIDTLTVAIAEDTEYVGKCKTSIAKYTLWCDQWVKYNAAKVELDNLKAQESGAPEGSLEELEDKLADALVEYQDIAGGVANARLALLEGMQHLKARDAIAALKMQLSQDGEQFNPATLTRKRGELSITRSNHEAKKREVVELQGTIRTKESLNAGIRAARALNKQLADNNQKILLQVDQLRKELETCEVRLDLIKTWQGILGSKGYRVARIKKFISSLNVLMVKYAQMVSGGRIKCNFFITDAGEIDFTITDEAKEMAYELWSGGEKARIKLVCLFAVLELLESMGSLSYNVLALDEIFSALDTDGKEGLFNVLAYLKGQNKAIYTIAHEDLALDLAYDYKVQARKFEDGTTEVKYV